MRKKFSNPKVVFPEDEGAHPTFPAEWWYGHFSLTDSKGREYGAMVAYFTIGLKVLSISDLAAGWFHHFVSGSALHYVEKKFDLRWGRDHWFRTDDRSPFYQLDSYGGGLSLNLGIIPDKPPLLGSGKGISKWTGGDSHYYSLTRLKVKGRIELKAEKLDVNGIGWMDHQWINSLGRGGWDWFAVQLDNNIELVVWRIVNPDESVRSYDLTIMFSDTAVYHTRKLSLEKLDSWVSPESSKEYGVLWRVRERARGLDLQIVWKRADSARIAYANRRAICVGPAQPERWAHHPSRWPSPTVRRSCVLPPGTGAGARRGFYCERRSIRMARPGKGEHQIQCVRREPGYDRQGNEGVGE